MAVTASWDTQQRPSYNPNAPRKLKPIPNLKPFPPITLPTRTDPSVFDILKRPTQEVKPVKVDLDDTYLGYEKWVPTPPKVEKPRSVFNAATLAYVGDCIYEDALLQELLNDSFLSNNERDVLRWGKNISSAKTKTKKRAGAAVYNRASSLETLIGYLYLTNVNRLEKFMLRLGFSTGTSAEIILKEINVKLILTECKNNSLFRLKYAFFLYIMLPFSPNARPYFFFGILFLHNVAISKCGVELLESSSSSHILI